MRSAATVDRLEIRDAQALCSAASRDRIEGLIGAGVREGGRVLVDGRDTRTGALAAGSFLKPTVIEPLLVVGLP